jgi:membrane associated rhomboid family serine protease
VTYYLPIATNVALRRVPFITLVLLALNTGAWFFLQLHPQGQSLLVTMAFQPAHPELSAAIVSCFLHASLVHLAGNMLYLWLFGAPVEDRIGPAAFAAVYMGVGVVSLFGQAAVMSAHGPADPLALVVGSSGAISAVLGLFVTRFPGAKIAIIAPPFVFGRRRLPGVGHVNALLAIAAYFLFELISGVRAMERMHQVVAYSAHIVGLLLGACVGVLMHLPEAFQAERMRADINRAVRMGHADQGMLASRRYLAMQPRDAEAWRTHARVAAEVGATRESVQAYTTAITLFGRTRRRTTALDTYEEMRDAHPHAPRNAALELAVARSAEAEGRFVAAAKWYGDVLDRRSGDVTEIEAWERLAEMHLTKTRDPESARAALDGLVARFPGTPAAARARMRYGEIARLRPRL